MKNQKNTANSMIKTILFWGSMAAVFAALLSMLGAFLIIKEVLLQSSVQYMTPAIAVISVFVSGLLAAKGHGEKRLIISLGTAAVYFLICLAAKLAFFPGSTVFMIRNVVLILTSAIFAAIVSEAKKGKKRYSARKRR